MTNHAMNRINMTEEQKRALLKELLMRKESGIQETESAGESPKNCTAWINFRVIAC